MPKLDPEIHEEVLNYYGQPITRPEYFDGKHVANVPPAGLPPICSCGWTPHETYQMSDHLDDQRLNERVARETRGIAKDQQ